MPLNRREATFQSALGHGCVSLAFTAIAGVGFSLTKIIVGSEFIHSCPSKDMIPVYIVISGCLPVLLSSLRQSFSKGNNSRKEDTFAMRVAFITAVFGIVVNLAWLVAGTYLVITTFKEGILCVKTEILVPKEASEKAPQMLEQNLPGMNSSLGLNSTNELMNETGSETNISNVHHIDNLNRTADIDLVSHNKPKERQKSHQYPLVTDGWEFRNNRTCILCDQTLLRFSLAVVIIDWTFVVLGFVYFCCFISRFITSIKSEFLLNS
ncbi:hypothetical protein ACF0H5_016728 [Mactra antiquata]